jgi:cytochrome c peroxidase
MQDVRRLPVTRASQLRRREDAPFDARTRRRAFSERVKRRAAHDGWRARSERVRILPATLVALAATISLATAYAGTGSPTPAPAVLAPGWEPLKFAPPEPGSYELPPLGDAADGAVLDTDGRRRRLFDFLGDKIAVLSFVYTACPDVNACPMANYVLSGVQRRILENPGLRDAVRLVTLSFDPEHDRPEVMRKFGDHLRRDGADWRFLTTDSEKQLAPILEAYGQSVQREYDENGRPLGTISHILRVFLIDRERRIRNIYTTSFLHGDTLWADLETLRREEKGTDVAQVAAATGSQLHGAGDDKRGYEREDYETRSKSLPARAGSDVDLLELARRPPLGLPAVPVSADNPVTAAKVALGRKLFFDRRLSHNDTMSCAMCHVPEQGFTSNEMATAVGIEGQTVRRNAPTIYNVAYFERLFHDARESRLEQQVWSPILAANEMGNPSIGYVLDKFRRLPDYAGLFEAAFDGRGPTMETLGMALASYERTVVSANSPFDRWYFGKEENALAAEARRGFDLFAGRAGCAGCHTIAKEHALFTDQQLHNTGLGYRQAMAPPAAERNVQVGPGAFLRFDPAVLGSAAERPPNDLGRYEVTLNPDDRWKYKTPSLRNVALTPPYMHDGSLRTLREVVEYYNAGGVPHELLDPRIKPLGLGSGEIDDLVAFLESLTGDSVDTLIADAFAAPVGDPG